MYFNLTYSYLTRHVVPGPQSISYLVPLVLLPIALLIPRSILSKWQNIAVFVPFMALATIHAWIKMQGVDVISVDVLLWCLFLVVFQDPWRDFSRLDMDRLHVEERRFKRRDKLGENVNNNNNNIKKKNVSPPTSPSTYEADEKTSLLKKVGLGSLAGRNSTSQRKVGFRRAELPYPVNEDLWTRIQWVGTLLVSIRLVNWKIESPSHDRLQPPARAFSSRKQFVAQTVISFIRGYLLLDLTSAYVCHDDFFTSTTLSIMSPLPFGAKFAFLPPHLVRTMITAIQAWALISQMFYLPCLVPVFLNYCDLIPDEWSPHTWPPYFGSWTHIFRHGVRGFWGRYWHQTMRYSVAGPGYALAHLLGLDEINGGLRRYALITTSGFLLSGTVHMGLVPPEPLHATLPVNLVRLLVASFFWMQLLPVLIEVLFIKFTRFNSVGSQSSQSKAVLVRIAVGIWVVTWFSFSLILLTEAGKQLGYWQVWPVPVSIWKGLNERIWIAWPFLQSL